MAGAAARPPQAAAPALPGLPVAHRPPWKWRLHPGRTELVESGSGRPVLQTGTFGILWTPAQGMGWEPLTPEHPVARTLADSAAVGAAVAELLAVAGAPDDPTGLVAVLAGRWGDAQVGYLALQLQRLRRLVPPATGGG